MKLASLVSLKLTSVFHCRIYLVPNILLNFSSNSRGVDDVDQSVYSNRLKKILDINVKMTQHGNDVDIFAVMQAFSYILSLVIRIFH